MDRLEAMSVIVAVTETGSISAASRRLKSPVATVSRKVAELEARLKAQLFERTSRRMTLTDAGRSYIDACRRIIEQVDDAEREVSGEYGLPKGEMAVTAPWGLGHTHLLPLAVEFLEAYPDISLRLMLTDRVINITEEEIDIAIRVGSLPDSSMIATRIGSIRIARAKAIKKDAELMSALIDDFAAFLARRASGTTSRNPARRYRSRHRCTRAGPAGKGARPYLRHPRPCGPLQVFQLGHPARIRHPREPCRKHRQVREQASRSGPDAR
jgi:DNA-binding transcriptional LysR family regulator